MLAPISMCILWKHIKSYTCDSDYILSAFSHISACTFLLISPSRVLPKFEGHKLLTTCTTADTCHRSCLFFPVDVLVFAIFSLPEQVKYPNICSTCKCGFIYLIACGEFCYLTVVYNFSVFVCQGGPTQSREQTEGMTLLPV